METKSGTWAVKDLDEEKGTVECVFSTFNVKDHDGDVTLPGAFTEGQAVAISAYGHRIWDGAPPMGKGHISSNSKEAVFKGQFFMDIDDAVKTFRAVKGMGEMQQWSYGFEVVDAEMGEKDGERVKFLKTLDVYEVSPVLRGAGIGTRTTSAKNHNGGRGVGVVTSSLVPIAVHETRKAFSVTEWKGADYGNTAPTFETLHAVHAAWDPTSNPLEEKSYAFAHHETAGGPANTGELLLIVGQVLALKYAPDLVPSLPRLSPTAIKGVYDHATAHLLDAGFPALPLDLSDEGRLKMSARNVMGLAILHENHSDELGQAAQRIQRGEKERSTVNAALTEITAGLLRKHRDLLDAPREAALREQMRFLKMSLELNGDLE